MFFASSHEASDSDHRCLYDTQQSLAREKGELTKQERHTARHIVLHTQVVTHLTLRYRTLCCSYSYYFNTGPY